LLIIANEKKEAKRKRTLVCVCMGHMVVEELYVLYFCAPVCILN